ncbi:oligosaccharide flippase family protein [Streptomyces caniscabiei]|uniref:lipopolysaccharide biosynthesis protein n=1 Tax=Streptomyces caniscabiei TaxID=2746961 RepID=UPI0029A5976E|nr:oligosaccharide flippase family protein [Streptomyces caniscabiei]MDX2776443.1 oligosaccharide flippase family protein [Streptomyces caniscabiei]
MHYFQRLKHSRFLKHNVVFFIGSVAVGVLNYAYYPVVGRLMEPAAFGELQVLVSLFLQFTIFLNVLGMITVNIMANYADADKAHRMIFEIEKLAAYAALALLLASIVAGEFLRQQLKFDSATPFAALALALLVSIPLTFRSAYARARERFGVASISQLIGSAVKIGMSALLVVVGLGVTGAIGGIILAQLAAFFYAARYAARVGFRRPPDTHYGTLPDLRSVLPELRYTAIVFVGLFAVTLMMSMDVILVKYFFDAHTAGLYAGIATVARIIFFVAAPIAQVLMPLVKTSRPDRQNNLLLLKSVGLTAGVSGLVLLACVVAPELVVRLLMGAAYVQYADILPRLALVVFIISLVNLVVMYYLALRRTMVTLVGIIGIVVLLSFVMMWHDTLHAVVNSMLLGSLFTLLTTGIYVLGNLRRGARDAKQNDFNRHSDI